MYISIFCGGILDQSPEHEDQLAKPEPTLLVALQKAEPQNALAPRPGVGCSATPAKPSLPPGGREQGAEAENTAKRGSR